MSTKRLNGYRVTAAKTNMIAALYNDTIRSSTDTSAVFLTDIKTMQKKCEPPVPTSQDKDGVYKINKNIWIPDEAFGIKFMIAVHSHCEESGHRDYAATTNITKCKYWWVDMKRDTKEFV